MMPYKLPEILSEQDFLQMLNLPKAILYISVNWSVYERVSRAVILKVLVQLQDASVPIYNVDCSEQNNKYVEEWLNIQATPMQHMYSNGYGETILIEFGRVVNYIKNPGTTGIENAKTQIEGWLA